MVQERYIGRECGRSMKRERERERAREREAMKQFSRNRWDKKNQEK